MKRLNKAAHKITNNLPKNNNYWAALLRRDWKSIVGEDISAVSCVLKIVHQKGDGACIHIGIVSSAALIMKYSEPKILKSINDYVGRSIKISNIALIHNYDVQNNYHIPPSTNEIKINQPLDERLKSDRLTVALEGLKTELHHAA